MKSPTPTYFFNLLRRICNDSCKDIQNLSSVQFHPTLCKVTPIDGIIFIYDIIETSKSKILRHTNHFFFILFAKENLENFEKENCCKSKYWGIRNNCEHFDCTDCTS